MSPQARHRALIAAARIACGGALLGCPSASTAPPQATVEAAVPAEASTPESLAACQQTTAAAFPNGEANDKKSVSAEVLACCQLVAEDHDAHGLANLGEWTERSGCCSALDWQGSSACTPWGPPTPPEMDA